MALQKNIPDLKINIPESDRKCWSCFFHTHKWAFVGAWGFCDIYKKHFPDWWILTERTCVKWA